MSKPIEFELYEVDDMMGDKLTLSAVANGTAIRLHVVDAATASRPTEASADFTSPAKLRALAAKINEAADALEKSQQTTFADLKPGEWFRWADGGVTMQKYDVDQWCVADAPTTRGAPHPASPVIRVRATFEDLS